LTSIVRSPGSGSGSGSGFAPQSLTASGGVITPNAALGYGPHRYTAAGNVTLAAPAGGTNGEPIEVQVTASGADRQLTISGTAITIPAGSTWWGHFSYDSGLDRWHLDDPGAGSGVSGYTDEQVRDVVAATLVQGPNVTITPNDGADTITISAATTGAAGIPSTIIDAKGDLIAGTADDTFARVPVGTDGFALVASSGAAAGLAWSDVALVAPPVHAVGNSGTALTLSASSASGWIKTVTLTGNCTFTLTGATSGRATTLELVLTQDGTGSRTVTWPASVKWSGGAPALSTIAGSVDRIVLTTYNGGTTWYGDMVGKGYA
jgi:hypothetical protein